ncbi:CheW domain-containing protein [Synechocystis sp. LEGE 06083]|uniref:CheW domain-containing protein n=1 Tax=Synechocystis sp. LEGE 06083 TaxID=915336 RepID=UPI001882EB43|nr:CheW domain-containing protein [Synechocystis sp. LEGE 06083]MBE9196585.1 CheW domain-containing protein [Synechocystis sp. LEGE 06083]
MAFYSSSVDAPVHVGQPSAPSVRPEKFLLFAVGKLNLALPIALVVKILPHGPSHGTGLSATGLVNLENRSVTMVDLYRRFFGVPQPPTAQTKQYFILTKNRSGEEFCLLVNNAPTLLDVLPQQIRQLPDSYRQNDTLQSASHVMLVEEKSEKLTVFLLDPDLLL